MRGEAVGGLPYWWQPDRRQHGHFLLFEKRDGSKFARAFIADEFVDDVGAEALPYLLERMERKGYAWIGVPL